MSARVRTAPHRSGARIAVDGLHDLGQVAVRNVPGTREDAERLLRADSAPELDTAFEQAMAHDPLARWAINHGMYVMGVDTHRAFSASYLDYTLADGIAERIRCPTLVCDAEEDMFFQGRPEQLYEHLTCPKTFMEFTTEEGAGAHCRPGAMRLSIVRICDWLDDTPAAAA
ncbi:hypothetical protein [Streptomyces sp. JL4002]|uniref:hypothetical protein n=1 Tax=Streptomyces sp. JL4002 TaxID=3404781 RepID=UPI003B28B185